jgi:ferredoxin
VGNGNVVLDIAEVLLRNPDTFDDLETMPDSVKKELHQSAVKQVTVFGRRGPGQASFTLEQLQDTVRQLKSHGVQIIVDMPAVTEADIAEVTIDTERTYTAEERQELEKKAAMLAFIQQLQRESEDPHPSKKQCRFVFNAQPSEFEDTSGTLKCRFQKTRLERQSSDRHENPRAITTDQFMEFTAGNVVTCIGNHQSPLIEDLTINEDGSTSELGVYTAGWYKTRGQGTVGDTMENCALTFAKIQADLESGAILPRMLVDHSVKVKRVLETADERAHTDGRLVVDLVDRRYMYREQSPMVITYAQLSAIHESALKWTHALEVMAPRVTVESKRQRKIEPVQVVPDGSGTTFPGKKTITVTVRNSEGVGKEVEVEIGGSTEEDNKSLRQALREKGILVSGRCGEKSACSECMCHIKKGEIGKTMSDSAAMMIQAVGGTPGYESADYLSCQSNVIDIEPDAIIEITMVDSTDW